MIKEAVIRQSSVRTLEKTTHGGLNAGDIGLITAHEGLDKTACLVHISMDQLFQDRNVIHISFSTNTSQTRSLYEDVFSTISDETHLDNATDVHDEVLKHRVIMNFNQNGIHMDEVEKSVRCLIEKSRFKAHCLVIDGYDFALSSVEELQELRRFAKELNLAVWFTVTLHTDHHGVSMPEELKSLQNEVTLILLLEEVEKNIHVTILKDHNYGPLFDSHLKLDIQTKLLTEEDDVAQ